MFRKTRAALILAALSSCGTVPELQDPDPEPKLEVRDESQQLPPAPPPPESDISFEKAREEAIRRILEEGTEDGPRSDTATTAQHIARLEQEISALEQERAELDRKMQKDHRTSGQFRQEDLKRYHLLRDEVIPSKRRQLDLERMIGSSHDGGAR